MSAPSEHPANETPDPSSVRPAHAFPIVGVGASAGGLESVSDLLRALPREPGLAMIIVQHLDPTHESHLATLLRRVTAVDIVDATDRSVIEPDHVYVMQSNTEVAMTDGHLAVTPRSVSRAPHFAIDHFFRSLASVQGSRAIGVVLSGTGSDGTLGLAEIKAAGGVTFAQDPRTAGHPGPMVWSSWHWMSTRSAKRGRCVRPGIKTPDSPWSPPTRAADVPRHPRRKLARGNRQRRSGSAFATPASALPRNCCRMCSICSRRGTDRWSGPTRAWVLV